MSFRAINEKYLEPGSQILMVLGIVALCQPWNMPLHTYGVTIILIGLIGFNVTSKIPREEQAGTGHGADQQAHNAGAQH
ncbi:MULTISPECIES: hypothetical protein [unclassified Mesorhizobium]|uniref:hypothetical protein n=1 Tax=unclassified Mesorhizobium TaxID=325217 RepID=UPI000F75BB99|nr:MULTISPECIES: hypothetical protein [unclassified Mesorhizobium]AZO03289.1 hypothetical protein EJ068_09405 [Mesorhizobium sp. M2A.F.Ca.ET.043.02.1.1]RUW37388.1 hypothetical protein EOA37_25430 [Mesorhizobium sp. M2A.F.Ca.ET.015.02.1.1]RUW73628.1 hypothetical protein EOA28_18380 [Mesorhizobium sp. M2A.F.Ca.ET.067.02.1.1]RVC92412.1 hypothetical protein EN739_25710 [Mesorhizobium sp. M2A.F.Ca.ET.017.03.2.1]RVD05110.1 hypothetical protein EN753_19880 [Mesorhizobium sp. M2A.F.Ca.ET.029.05.1.1]